MKSFLAVAAFASGLASVGAQKMDGNMTQMDPGRRNASSSTACADVHFMVVRGSKEPKGQGMIGSLATMVSTMYPGSSVEAIKYPASRSKYNSSVSRGTKELTKRIEKYVDGCGKAKLVLMGYSQGAHVVGDALCGGGEGMNLGPATPALGKKFADKVVAVIQMGDPRFMAKKSFDKGTATMNGLFPRPADISCDAHASMIQSYCDVDDPVCSSGKNSTVHRMYTEKYNMDAHEFVMMQLKSAGAMSGMGGMGGMKNAASLTATGSNVGYLVTAASIFIALFMI